MLDAGYWMCENWVLRLRIADCRLRVEDRKCIDNVQGILKWDLLVGTAFVVEWDSGEDCFEVHEKEWVLQVVRKFIEFFLITDAGCWILDTG